MSLAHMTTLETLYRQVTDRNHQIMSWRAEQRRWDVATMILVNREWRTRNSDLVGTVYLEGPHYPAPHTWYAQCEAKDGKIVRVK